MKHHANASESRPCHQHINCPLVWRKLERNQPAYPNIQGEHKDQGGQRITLSTSTDHRNKPRKLASPTDILSGRSHTSGEKLPPHVIGT
eukprot:5287700-Amphidinium_carterae.2